MDADSELEGQLLQQFSSLGTTDKDVLIAEFQKLLGNQLNPAGCAFFLDMNNWNLQAAICSYYDLDQPSVKVPQLTFISDITVGEGEAVPPDTRFTKTWRISNSGDEKWPPGCHLKFCAGENLSLSDRTLVDALEPGQVADVTVEMHSRLASGVYQSQWRMSTATGLFFGEPIWVIVTVAEGGVLGVTQQLSKFGTDFIHTSVSQDSISNPFASPTKSSGEISNISISPQNSLVAQQDSPFLTHFSPSPVRNPHLIDAPNGTTARSLFPTAIDDRPGSKPDTNCTEMHEDMS